MKEMGVKELLERLEMSWVHGGAKANQAYNQLVKLINDSKAYDERIDKIVEHYRRQDSEPKVVDEEIVAWLDNEYVSMGHALGMLLVPTDGEHFTDSELASKANLEWGQQVINKIKQLLSQKRVVTRGQVGELADSLQWDLQPGEEPNLDIKDIVKSLMKHIPKELGMEVKDA